MHANKMELVSSKAVGLAASRRAARKIQVWGMASARHRYQHTVPPEQLRCRLNSMLGLLSHYCCYRLRCYLFLPLLYAWWHGCFLSGMSKYVLRPVTNGRKVLESFGR